MEVVIACLNIIWECRLTGSLKFWALENPVGFLRQFLGIPHYQFYQWQFGEYRIKRTDIWGYFKEPIPMIKTKPDFSMEFPKGMEHGAAWSKMQCPDEYKYLNLDRTAIRAITPPGFAQAFFKANR